MDHCLLEDFAPQRPSLLDEAAPGSMRRDELEAVGQAHECALAWADELEDVPYATAEVALELVLTILQKFPAEQGEEEDRLYLD